MQNYYGTLYAFDADFEYESNSLLHSQFGNVSTLILSNFGNENVFTNLFDQLNYGVLYYCNNGNLLVGQFIFSQLITLQNKTFIPTKLFVACKITGISYRAFSIV